MPFDPQDWMVGVETAWWLLFVATFGLCLGSFLNVVIFRIPRNLSISDPAWSFCPSCHARIRWYDNLPVLSYLRLGGRCRDCGNGISPRYPLVEMLTALVVILLLDAFFVEKSRSGLSHGAIGMTWQLGDDWPIYLAHVILFAALLAMSAVDIENYWVDIRFTHAATIAGFILHAAWSPGREADWVRPSAGWGAAALVATVTMVVVLAIAALFRRNEDHPEEPGAPAVSELIVADGVVQPPVEPAELPTAPEPAAGSIEPLAIPLPAEGDTEAPETGPLGQTPPTEPTADAVVEETPSEPPAPQQPAISGARVLAIMTGLSLLLALAGAWMAANRLGFDLPAPVRWAPGLGLIVLLIIASAAAPRESDHEIVASIEAERHSARRMVLGETALLLPAIVLGGVTLYYGLTCGNTQRLFAGVLDWSPWGEWSPLQGLATAAIGFVIGAGIGWVVRILGTLGFGREALGAGDIHMMAAAGCVAGWEVVLVGFVLCSLLALFGWVATLPFKRSRAIPLGPWLSLGFLLVVLFYKPIMSSPTVQNTAELFRRL